MNCNKDGKSLPLGKMQSPKINYCPARVSWLLAKVKGNYFNKVFLLQVKQTMLAKLLTTKNLFIYRNRTTFKKQNKWHLLSTTFGKSRFSTYKRHAAVSTVSIYFYKSSSAIMPSQLYKA